MNIKVMRIGLVIAIIISIIVLNIGISVINTYKTEKNAGVILKSIVQMELEKKAEIKLNDLTYLTKSNSNFVKLLMKNDGWNLEEQLGSDYRYRNSEGKYKTVRARLVYSSNYIIWDIEK